MLFLPLRDFPRMPFLNKTKPTHCANLTSICGFPCSNFWDGWASFRCEISSLKNGGLWNWKENMQIQREISGFCSTKGNIISFFCYYMESPSHLPLPISKHSVCAYMEKFCLLIRCCWVRISHMISEHSSFVPCPLRKAELTFSTEPCLPLCAWMAFLALELCQRHSRTSAECPADRPGEEKNRKKTHNQQIWCILLSS